jgi:hypothetical protein
MLHNFIIFSIIPENNTPFRPAVSEELRGNEVCRHFAKICHKTIYFMQMRKSIFKGTIPFSSCSPT